MIDAAEAWASVQRERKLGLSCTQDQDQREEAGAGKKGSSDGTYSPTACPRQMPTARGVALALRASAISLLGTLGTSKALTVSEHMSQKELSRLSSPSLSELQPVILPLCMHFAILIFHMNYYFHDIYLQTDSSFFLYNFKFNFKLKLLHPYNHCPGRYTEYSHSQHLGRFPCALSQLVPPSR